MAQTETVLTKHLKAIADEIKSLRGWLDYLERDITNDKGVISAVILASISESCMKLIYNAGIANGAVLSAYENAEMAQTAKGESRNADAQTNHESATNAGREMAQGRDDDYGERKLSLPMHETS